jgi:hypothetical protein
MTMGIHDGGCGGGGERGIAILASDSAARQAGDHCEGGREGDGGEPYVVFGYGSLIFRVRPCIFVRSRLVSLYSLPHAFSLSMRVRRSLHRTSSRQVRLASLSFPFYRGFFFFFVFR